jgi:hypothetical protein
MMLMANNAVVVVSLFLYRVNHDATLQQVGQHRHEHLAVEKQTPR